MHPVDYTFDEFKAAVADLMECAGVERHGITQSGYVSIDRALETGRAYNTITITWQWSRWMRPSVNCRQPRLFECRQARQLYINKLQHWALWEFVESLERELLNE